MPLRFSYDNHHMFAVANLSPRCHKMWFIFNFFLIQLDMNLNTGLSTGGILNSMCLNQNLQNFMVRSPSFGKPFSPAVIITHYLD